MFVRLFKHIEYPKKYSSMSSMIPSVRNLTIHKPYNSILNRLEKNIHFKNYYQTGEFWKYKPNWDKKELITEFHPLQQFHDRDEGR